jgi:hypothetical protein
MKSLSLAQIAIGLLFGLHATLKADQFIVRSNQKDIWTTSFYSYAPGGNKPGGGEDNEYLRIGGWGDIYLSLLQFEIKSLPAKATSATLRLYAAPNTSNPTGFYLDRITAAWDWRTSGTGRDRDRLWWVDRPAAVQWSPSAYPPPTRGAWYEIDITTLYNAWRAGTVPHHGIQLRPTNTSNNSFERFYSANHADPAFHPQLVVESDAAFQSLPSYLHNLSDGRQALRNLLRMNGGQFSFIFGTSDPGATCIVSSSNDLSQWSSLLLFTPTTAGTQVLDTDLSPTKFYRAIYLPTGVSAAESFIYPIGTGIVSEQITPEQNSLYPNEPSANPDRGSTSPGTGWYNAQDTGSYYSTFGGLHAAEDWNRGSGSADVGEQVKAVANGQIIDIRPANSSDPSRSGFTILIRHWLQNGDSVDSLYLHVAPDQLSGSPNNDGIFGNESDFSYQEGEPVAKSSVIGVIGAVTSPLMSPHLHFEMRVTKTDPSDLWPNDTGDGYYGPIPGFDGNRNSSITAEEVAAAFILMQKDGIVDPSDFIDAHQ